VSLIRFVGGYNTQGLAQHQQRASDIDSKVFFITCRVKKKKINYLDFEIDKLTRSVENVLSGDSFPTDISYLTRADLNQLTKKNGWLLIGRKS
jgi:hypothetical protein